jgi:tRNA-2-methylthio-N6-dimethylallyladenosine synthase
MPYCYIWTIGCQMNRAESERLEAHLDSLGYAPTSSAEAADLIILNSCVVRQSAEDKVTNKLSNLKALKKLRPGLKIALTGCMVSPGGSELASRFPYVDFFFKPGEIPAWLDDTILRLPRNPGISVFVPIIQGCNNFCTYCIVPYRRGREKSRPFNEIVDEVTELVRCGVREVTLLGQNVDSYGHDLMQKPDLAALLTALNGIKGLWRIRFLTNHPKDMSQRLIDAMAQLDKVCESINLPIQAGDDAILQEMGRGYTMNQYIELISRLRRKVPNIAITTDVIVGFPGETDEQFQNSANLLAALKFDAVHVAAYSPRSGTMAAEKLTDNVPPEIKRGRLAFLECQQEQISYSINTRLLGQRVEVLVETKKRGKWQGRSRSDKLVFFTGGEELIGKLVNIKIEKCGPWSLQGKLMEIKEA